MFFIGDIGILDINGLLNVYNQKLPSSRRMTNSEMKDILDNLEVKPLPTEGNDNIDAKSLINKYTQT